MVDLHTHSTHSDGSFTPKELMDYAYECGLAAIALTDHDVISGLKEAAERASELKIHFIPGVELEVEYEKGEFHILGLSLSQNLNDIEKVLIDIQQKRKNRNKYIVEKICAAGIKCSLDIIKEYAGGDLISRLHFAHFLIDKGIVGSVTEAFHQYLNSGKPFYMAKEVLTLTRALQLIKHAHGKAIAAHPFTLNLSWDKLTNFLLSCKKAGLHGVEAYHSDFKKEECDKLDKFARQYGFIITAGSDFHGENRVERKLGISSSGMEIADDYARPFLK
jgi:predicted metal-dependent phosphoesterase TrpH